MKLHTSCKTLTLEKFIPATCNGDLSGLIIEGTPTPEELNAAWVNINMEWSELTENSNKNIYLSALKEFYIERARYNALLAGVQSLAIEYNEAAEKALNDLGYTVNLRGLDPPEYIKHLDQLTKRLKGVQVAMANAYIELERISSKLSETKMSEKEFMEYVAAVQKFSGHFPLSVTVWEFAAKSNLMERSIGNGRR